MTKRKKTGGRKTGTPNKVTATAREAFQHAFQQIGGSDRLAAWAESHETDFYKLFARLIPAEINLGGQQDNPIRLGLAEMLGQAKARKRAHDSSVFDQTCDEADEAEDMTTSPR